MKKLFLLITGIACLTSVALGGGIVTNINQSARYVRVLALDASTGIDAVYFNPAGLIKLDNGFHFSVNNLTILQSKEITDNYVNLIPSPKTFKGDISAPFFPNIYAVWNTGKLAISVGFNPIGGGGSAEFSKGLPSFESRLADLVPIMSLTLSGLDAALLQAPPNGYGFNPQFSNITGYQSDIYFKGTSVFYGYQGGLTYKINEFLGLYAGVRFVTAKNTYKGSITDVMIAAAPVEPPVPLYDVPAGNYTPGNYLRAVAGATGLDPTTIAVLNGTANALDAQTAIEADAEETGSGITPIIGANISLGDKLDVGLKYEFRTAMDLTTTVHDGKDAYGMFVQDSTVHSDMPAMLTVGVSYKIMPNLSAMAGVHYFFDKSANYGKSLDEAPTVPVSNDKVINNNLYEIAVGLEYNITDNFLISGGYLRTQTGVSEDFQSDLSFSLSANTVGIGAGFNLMPNLMINVGASYSKYDEGKKNYMHTVESIGTQIPAVETYNKETWMFGIGVDFSL